jgi:hypothetical protein
MTPGHDGRARWSALALYVVVVEADSLPAILSMRGVGIVPPYAPKAPQPMLSTSMKTMLGAIFLPIIESQSVVGKRNRL